MANGLIIRRYISPDVHLQMIMIWNCVPRPPLERQINVSPCRVEFGRFMEHTHKHVHITMEIDRRMIIRSRRGRPNGLLISSSDG